MSEKRYKVKLAYDQDAEMPESAGLFRLHSFSNRHISFTHPDEIEGREGFPLSYFEHGLCRWDLAGTMSNTPDFRWDGVEFAGFLEVNPDGEMDDKDWWDGLTIEEREKIAAGYLEGYTSWANGDVWGYTITKMGQCDRGFDHDEEIVDSCWGFIGSEWFLQEVKEVLPEDATEDNTEVIDPYGVTSYTDLFEKVEA